MSHEDYSAKDNNTTNATQHEQALNAEWAEMTEDSKGKSTTLQIIDDFIKKMESGPKDNELLSDSFDHSFMKTGLFKQFETLNDSFEKHKDKGEKSWAGALFETKEEEAEDWKNFSAWLTKIRGMVSAPQKDFQ